MMPPQDPDSSRHFEVFLDHQMKAVQKHWPPVLQNIKSADIGEKAAGLAKILCVTARKDNLINLDLKDQGRFSMIFKLLEISTLDWSDDSDSPGNGVRPHNDVDNKWDLVLGYLNYYFRGLYCNGNPEGRCGCDIFPRHSPVRLSAFNHHDGTIQLRKMVERSTETQNGLEPSPEDYGEFEPRAAQFLRDFYNELVVKKNIIEVFRSWLVQVVDAHKYRDTPIAFHLKALAKIVSPAFPEEIEIDQFHRN